MLVRTLTTIVTINMILPFPPQSLNLWLAGWLAGWLADWLVLLFLLLFYLVPPFVFAPFPRESLLVHLVALIPEH